MGSLLSLKVLQAAYFYLWGKLMGKSFVLQGEIIFKQPNINNIRKYITSLNTQLAKLNRQVNLKISAPNLSKVNKSIQDLNKNVISFASNINNLSKTVRVNSSQVSKTINNANKSTQQSFNSVSKSVDKTTDAFERFGRQAAISARRYVSFAAVTGAFIKLTQAIRSNITEAINFDREVVRLLQVTGKTRSGIADLTGEIDRLSKSIGVSSKDLLDVSVTLAQAGLTARETKTALEAIAKSGVSASFGNMKDTGEAVIAIFQQFGYQAKDLEGILSSVNKVSAAFAVEAGDITTAVRRAGSSFKSAGASFNEFQSLFTSVRQTTRESAESIATGLRTIISRLQRVRTQNFFKDLGINLLDEGKFVGPLKAIERIAQATQGLSRQDPVFASIAEELGGFRQINKVIPLLDKIEVTRKANNIALRAENSLTDDAAVAQQALAVQLEKVRQEFQALVREISTSEGMKDLIRVFLTLSSAIIKTVDALQGLIPLISAVGAFKAAGKFSKVATGFFGFNKGGGVPGIGNGDTVPAFLTPGEFVVNKKSAQAYGYDNLKKINKYAKGGTVGGANDEFYNKRKKLLDSLLSSLSRINPDFKNLGPSLSVHDNLMVGGRRALGSAKGYTDIELDRKSDESTLRHELAHILDFQQGFLHKKRKVGELPHQTENSGISDFQKFILELGKRKLPEDIKAYFPTGNTNSDPGLLSYLNQPKEIFARMAGRLTNKQFGALAHSDTKSGISHLIKKGFRFDESNVDLLKQADIYGTKNKRVRIRPKVSTGGSGGVNTPNPPGPPSPPIPPSGGSGSSGGSGYISNVNLPPVPLGGTKSITSKLASPTGAIAGVGILAFLSQFGDSVKSIIPTITTLASAFFLLSTTIKAVSKDSLPTLKAEAKERKTLRQSGKDYQERARQQSIKSDIYKHKVAGIDKQIATTTDPYELARLNRKKAAAQKFGSELKDESNKNLGLSNEAFSGARNVTLSSRARKARRNRNINIGSAIGATALASAPFLSDAANTNALAGQEKTFGLSTVGVAGVGGALSGAVNTGATGAAIGSIFGPAGTLIGAAAGGVVGALHGLVTSIDETSKKIQLAKFGNEVQELRQKLRLVSEGKLAKGSANIGIIGSIKQASLLSNTDNVEQRQNIVATFNENQSEIEDFFYEIAKQSKNFEEFDKRTQGLLGTFSVLTKIPFKDLKKSIENNLNYSAKQIKQTADEITLTSRLLENITVMNVTIGAFNSAALAIEDTNRKLEQFSSAIDGSVSVLQNKDVSSVIKEGGQGNLFGKGSYSAAVQQVSGFIPGGEGRANSLIESNKVNQVLPAILKRVANTVPLGGEGNFESRLEKELSNVTNNKDVISSILTQVGGVIGPTGEDKNAIERVNKDVIGFAKELGDSFSPLNDLFAEGASRLQERINATVKAFDDLRKITQNIISLENDRVGIEENLDKTIKERLGITNQGNAGFNKARLQNITGGETSISGLLKQFNDSRKGISNLDVERSNTLDPNKQQKLVEKQSLLAEAADRARQGLEFLARESNDLGDRFNKDVEKGRALRSDALTSVTGTAEERINLRRQNMLVDIARSSGSFQSIPEEDRRGVSEKIETLFPEEFKKIFASDLQRQGLSKEEAEARVQGKTNNTDAILEEIKNNAKTQSDAISALQNIQSTLAGDIQNGITSANTQFVSEIKSLGDRIKELSDSIITQKNDQEQRNKAVKDQLGSVNSLFSSGQVNSGNFASITGLSDLLTQRKGLLESKKGATPEEFEKLFMSELNAPGATKDKEALLKTFNNIEAKSGISLSSVAPGLVNSFDNISFGSEKEKATYFGGQLRGNVSGLFGGNSGVLGKQLTQRNEDLTKQLGENTSSINTTGFQLKDTANIDKAAQTIKEFVDAVNRAGGSDKIPHFASGGVVPGSGSRDNVLGILTPGEVVLNKNQVKASRGGGGYSIDASGFNDVVVKFSNSASALSKSLDQFPREITLSARHTVEVVFNGAEILTRLMPEIQNIAIEQSKVAINKMIDQKFPDVGRVR